MGNKEIEKSKGSYMNLFRICCQYISYQSAGINFGTRAKNKNKIEEGIGPSNKHKQAYYDYMFLFQVTLITY